MSGPVIFLSIYIIVGSIQTFILLNMMNETQAESDARCEKDGIVGEKKAGYQKSLSSLSRLYSLAPHLQLLGMFAMTLLLPALTFKGTIKELMKK